MIEYRPIKAADLPLIKELYARHLNSGKLIAQQIDLCWREGSYVGYTAKEEGELLGFLTVRPGIDFTYPHPELEAELADFVGEKRLAMCDALLVLPGFRNEGVAHVLAERIRELLIQMSYDYFLEEIWIYPDGSIPAKKALESIGRVVWRRRYDSFYRELDKYDMSCPICGRDCVCGAWVEVLEL